MQKWWVSNFYISQSGYWVWSEMTKVSKYQTYDSKYWHLIFYVGTLTLHDASVCCLPFHIISTEHLIITQAASQWVLSFSGSLPIVLIYLWLIIFFVSLSENKYDDDDDTCWNSSWIADGPMHVGQHIT